MLSDPKRLARWTIAFAYLWLVGSIVQTALYVWRIKLLGGLGDAPQTPEAIARLAEAPDPTHIGFVLISILYHIAFLRWVYVVNRNAQQWSDAMTISPGWNVGWFFVPIACLWKPFEGIRESRGATIDAGAPESVDVPTWLRLWWGLSIGASIYGNVTAMILGVTETPDQWISASWMNVASIVIDVPLAVLTCRLLRDISMLQSARIAAESQVPPE